MTAGHVTAGHGSRTITRLKDRSARGSYRLCVLKGGLGLATSDIRQSSQTLTATPYKRDCRSHGRPCRDRDD
jgi:hypothetical protein